MTTEVTDIDVHIDTLVKAIKEDKEEAAFSPAFHLLRAMLIDIRVAAVEAEKQTLLLREIHDLLRSRGG